MKASAACLATMLIATGCSGAGDSEPPAAPDTVAPTVVSTVPDGTAKVAVDSILTVTFSEPLDPASVAGATVSLDGVPTTFSFRCSSVFVDPTDGLSRDTAYTLRIAGVRDPAGNAMEAPFELAFQTESAVTAIAAGTSHTLALKNDGTVWVWGTSEFGDVTAIAQVVPVEVGGLAGGAALAGGLWSSIVATNDGAVWTWGFNDHGQLGDETVTDRSSPVQVVGLADVSAVAAGDRHAMALKTDGTVWTWGDNGLGQLGVGGTTPQRSRAGQVAGLANVSAIGGGSNHAIVSTDDGAVWTWGNNYSGQLGDGTTSRRESPVRVGGLAEVSAVSGGGTHSVALKRDGTVWSWGSNDHGQLADGTTTQRTAPVQASGLVDVLALAAGDAHTIALRRDGSVWAWGANDLGQLGDGTNAARSTPVQVVGLRGVSAIATKYNHSAALKDDGSVWTWGDNGGGQLGDGTQTSRNTPVPVVWSGRTVAVPAATQVGSIGGVSSATFFWLDVPEATSYTVYYSTSPDVSATSGIRVDCAVSPLVIEGLRPGVPVYAFVVTSNAYGDGASSNVTVATPTAPPTHPDECEFENKCGTVSGGIEWAGTWIPEDCSCPDGLDDGGGGFTNSLCGLPGPGTDCRFCGCPY